MFSQSLHRALALLVGCMSMTVGGTYLLTSILLVNIKAQFNLTQPAAELLVGVGVAAANLAYPWGILLEHISIPTAYAVSMAIGCSGAALLYTADFLVNFYRTNWALLALYWGCVCTASVVDHLVAVSVNLGNFPRHRQGIVMGLLSCCWWLGQSLLYYVYSELQRQSPDSAGQIFLVLGIWMCVVKGLGAVFVRPIPLADDDTIPMVPKPRATKEGHHESSENVNDSPLENDASVRWWHCLGLDVIRQTDFQLILWGFMLGVGTQVMFIGNISIMATSPRLSNIYTLVLILSPMVSMVVSLFCGWLSDITLELFPRATYLSVAAALQAVAYGMAAIMGATGWVFITTIFLMFINSGLYFAMSGSILAERFGLTHFKKHWGMALMLAAGMAFMMVLIFGKIYQDECEAPYLSCTCVGPRCFSGAYIFGAIASATSAFCFVLLQRHQIMMEFK